MTEKYKKIFAGVATPPLPTSAFHAELDGLGKRMSATFSGINSIRDFSDTDVTLRARGFLVKIKGATLSLAVYENKTVEISGRILCVEFVYDKT